MPVTGLLKINALISISLLLLGILARFDNDSRVSYVLYSCRIVSVLMFVSGSVSDKLRYLVKF